MLYSVDNNVCVYCKVVMVKKYFFERTECVILMLCFKQRAVVYANFNTGELLSTQEMPRYCLSLAIRINMFKTFKYLFDYKYHLNIKVITFIFADCALGDFSIIDSISSA